MNIALLQEALSQCAMGCKNPGVRSPWWLNFTQ